MPVNGYRSVNNSGDGTEMKKVLTTILAAVMTLSLVTVSAAANTAREQSTLRFDENGKFKILFLADVQDVYPMKEAAVEFIKLTP